MGTQFLTALRCYKRAYSPILRDEFLVIKYSELLPTDREDPASYEGVKPRLLERESTIDDICDFFVEYMQSDVVVRCCTVTLTPYGVQWLDRVS